MARYKNREKYNYEIYKKRELYTPKYKPVTLTELVNIFRSYGMFVTLYSMKKLYYIGFRCGWLKHRSGRYAKTDKRHKKKRLVLDEERLEKWISYKIGIVPEGYKRAIDLAEDFGVKYGTIRDFISDKKIEGFPITKMRIGRWVYYNENEFKNLWIAHRFRNK